MSTKPDQNKENTTRVARTSRLTQLALLTALSIAIYGVERLLPVAPIPGVRLGLANLITLVALRKFGPRDTVLVLFARIILSTLLFGQMVSMIYSLCGGFACLLAELWIDHLLQQRFLHLTSAVGAVVHNMAQLLVAILITGTMGVIAYLPYLIIAGIATGLFLGVVADFFLKHWPRNITSS